jgi:hypothetical protein
MPFNGFGIGMSFYRKVPLVLLVIVGSSTATTGALFLDQNRKSNFRHPL